MQVELALPVSQQDHRGVRREGSGGAAGAGTGGVVADAPIPVSGRAGKPGAVAVPAVYS